MIETLIGFIGGVILDFIRGLVRDRAARTDATARGRAENQNKNLRVRLKAKERAQKIGERVDDEENLNNLVDSL